MKLDDWIREIVTDISEEYEMSAEQSLYVYENIVKERTKNEQL